MRGWAGKEEKGSGTFSLIDCAIWAGLSCRSHALRTLCHHRVTDSNPGRLCPFPRKIAFPRPRRVATDGARRHGARAGLGRPIKGPFVADTFPCPSRGTEKSMAAPERRATGTIHSVLRASSTCCKFFVRGTTWSYASPATNPPLSVVVIHVRKCVPSRQRVPPGNDYFTRCGPTNTKVDKCSLRQLSRLHPTITVDRPRLTSIVELFPCPPLTPDAWEAPRAAPTFLS